MRWLGGKSLSFYRGTPSLHNGWISMTCQSLGFYIWSAAAIVSSEPASQRVTRLNQGSQPNCQDPVALTSLKQKRRHPVTPVPNETSLPRLLHSPASPYFSTIRKCVSAAADAEEEQGVNKLLGSAKGTPVVTQKEVLQLAANWVRIMSVVSQPNALQEHI